MTALPERLDQRLNFDRINGQVLDGPRRYVVMRTDVLMGTFDQLTRASREPALVALGKSVARYGADSVRAYLRESGPDALLQVMVDNSSSLGWGVWHFQIDEESVFLEVANSPFASGTTQNDMPVCHAIAGMFQGMLAVLWSEHVNVQEVRCACMHRSSPGSCHFRAAKIPMPSA